MKSNYNEEIIMKYSSLAFFMTLMLSGCSATWGGVKTDTSHAVDWTKDKVNQGATYVKEKTE